MTICKRCRASLDAKASFCRSCNKYIDFREPLKNIGDMAGVVTAVAAAFIALNIGSFFERAAEIDAFGPACSSTGVSFTLVNYGDRSGVVTDGKLAQYLVETRDLPSDAPQGDTRKLIEWLDERISGHVDDPALDPAIVKAMRGPTSFALMQGTQQARKVESVSSANRSFVIEKDGVKLAQFAISDVVEFEGEDGSTRMDYASIKTPVMFRSDYPDVYATRPAADGGASPLCIQRYSFAVVDTRKDDDGREKSISFVCACDA